MTMKEYLVQILNKENRHVVTYDIFETRKKAEQYIEVLTLNFGLLGRDIEKDFLFEITEVEKTSWISG